MTVIIELSSNAMQFGTSALHLDMSSPARSDMFQPIPSSPIGVFELSTQIAQERRSRQGKISQANSTPLRK